MCRYMGVKAAVRGARETAHVGRAIHRQSQSGTAGNPVASEGVAAADRWWRLASQLNQTTSPLGQVSGSSKRKCLARLGGGSEPGRWGCYRKLTGVEVRLPFRPIDIGSSRKRNFTMEDNAALLG